MAKHKEKEKEKDLKSWPIYLYVPNLIGYARIMANIVAFGECFSNKKLFTALYFVSFVCDELDGRFARMLNQASTFGAVLDMLTDRVSTAALLVVLSHLYRPCFAFFLSLLALDIASHWLQMYSSFLSSKTSHKDVKDSKSWLIKAYYQHRLFMGYCCIGAEVLYLVLYILAEDQPHGVIKVFMAGIKQRSPLMILGLFALPGWAIKQIVNVVQWKKKEKCIWFLSQKVGIKISFCGPSKGNPGLATSGGIFRNNKGEPILSYCEALGKVRNNVAKAKALWRGMSLAEDKEWS